MADSSLSAACQVCGLCLPGVPSHHLRDGMDVFAGAPQPSAAAAGCSLGTLPSHAKLRQWLCDASPHPACSWSLHPSLFPPFPLPPATRMPHSSLSTAAAALPLSLPNPPTPLLPTPTCPAASATTAGSQSTSYRWSLQPRSCLPSRAHKASPGRYAPKSTRCSTRDPLRSA